MSNGMVADGQSNTGFVGWIIGAIALVLAAIIIYLPSPIFPMLSDNATYYGLGWERRGEGSWNDFLGWLRSNLKGFNRTLLDPAFIRPFFVASACIIALHTTSPWPTHTSQREKTALVFNAILVALLLFAVWVLARKLSLGSDALFIPKTIDIIAAMFGVVVVVELVRRLAGWMMFGLIILAVIYMKWGDPFGMFYATSSKTWELLALNFWLETTGAMGFALSIMIQNVVIFILFGVVIQATGAADAILKIALVATRKLRGGPAHAAIVSSALFGTFSGSAAANVVGTGTFTIPLIKSRGFSPRFAGGIEAAASTGGQFTPPVMGAAAFYLAEQAQVPYSQVAIAVMIPALFYFGSLFVAVEFQARKTGIRPAVSSEIRELTRDDWIKSLSFFAPLAAIIYCLWAGYSVNRAGFWAIAMTVLFGLLNPEFRASPGRLIEKLKEGGIAVSQLLAIVAGLGVFIGVVEGTGLGPKIGSDLGLLVEDNLFVALLLTMVASLVLSMGMPTLPAYATIITIMGIFLVQLAGENTPILAVHLFVLYFGVLSPVTPPVALAAYAAAPIAKAHPLETGISAVLLCSVAFVIPYAFFYHPQLLVGQVDFNAGLFTLAVVKLGLCVWMLTTATSGWAVNNLQIWSRILRSVVAVLLISSVASISILAIALTLAILAWDFFKLRSNNKVGHG